MPVIEKIVEMPVTFLIPMLSCGHAGRMTSLKDTLRIGDEEPCLTCEMSERSGDEKE